MSNVIEPRPWSGLCHDCKEPKRAGASKYCLNCGSGRHKEPSWNLEDSDSLDGYQHLASTTAQYPGKGTSSTLARCYVALGLTGEAGEYADKVKRIIRGDSGASSVEAQDQRIEELGDVLWYLANACIEEGISLSHVARINLDKLFARKAASTIKGTGDRR